MDTRTTAFSDSNYFSGTSSIGCVANTETMSPEVVSAPEIAALRRLSENLESIFDSQSPDFTDAIIVLSGGREIAVHRCILSARSPFCKSVFAAAGNECKLELKELAKDFDLSFEALNTVLAYLYTGKVKSLPKGVCVCVDEECLHIACRPAVDFLVEVLYGAFIFQISELVALYQRHPLDILDKVAADDILVVLCVANVCGTACERLLASCIEFIVKSDVDVITLEKTIPRDCDIVKQIVDSRLELGLHEPEINSFPDKHVQGIYRALDSDDVELLRMFLDEGHSTLDDAYALHYAVAYCDTKTTMELLDLALADVNRKNWRGYSVLHIAAMRREPEIIGSLLTRGARSSDLTSDGRKALHISKRLTRAVDYYKSTEDPNACPKDRLCIEILEQEEKSDPPKGEAFFPLDMPGTDLCVRFLLYFELRVGLAKLMFPTEAKVAMNIAQVDGTSEFPSASMHSRNMAGAQRTMVDPIEVPFEIKEEHLNRLRALSKTVELGKRFFPRCSEVLNKIVDAEDLTELAYLGNGSLEERQLKKRRYTELQDDLRKAFTEDKEELNKSNNLSASSSSTSNRVMRPNGNKLTFKK